MDDLLFNPVKNRLSKRLAHIFTGGAPLHPETGTFLKLYLNVNLRLGYGATETMGAAGGQFSQFDHDNTVSCRFS